MGQSPGQAVGKVMPLSMFLPTQGRLSQLLSSHRHGFCLPMGVVFKSGDR